MAATSGWDRTYDQLSEEASARIEQLTAGHVAGDDPLLDKLAGLFGKRHFGTFRTLLAARGPLPVALLELLLIARIRLYALAYLSVQEGEEFEAAERYDTRAPVFILQFLRYLGRRSNCEFRPGVGWLRVRIDIDPMVPLRALYALHLFAARRGGKPTLWERVKMGWQKWRFAVRCKAVGAVLRAGGRGAGGDDWLRRVFGRPEVRRAVATGIHVLFPTADQLSDDQWGELLRRVEGYLVPRLAALVQVMPATSVSDHGFIKLFKVAFGTLVGRTAARKVHEPGEVDFIVNTLRLAYSWGVTYPLVDNVLDSKDTTPEVRRRLTDTLRTLFEGGEPAPLAADEPGCVREVRERLTEVLSLIPEATRQAARRALAHLLESHKRDAVRRLSAVGTADVRRAVLADTALKAALVRLATMEVCGLSVDAATYRRCLDRSLFNQFGDDLWDIYEDHDDDRTTPFTLYLTRPAGENPFHFYFRYTTVITAGLSRRRRTAALMGCCETLRDALGEIRRRGSDPLGVEGQIHGTLAAVGGRAMGELVNDIPHVDFDAILFAIEAALLAAFARQG